MIFLLLSFLFKSFHFSNPVYAYVLQIIVAANHMSGKDTHVRGLRVLGPIESVVLFFPISQFAENFVAETERLMTTHFHSKRRHSKCMKLSVDNFVARTESVGCFRIEINNGGN